MKRKKKSTSGRKNLEIYHHELNLDGIGGFTYWLITEAMNGVPLRTYYYQIPESYKNDSLLGKMLEKYCTYSPN